MLCKQQWVLSKNALSYDSFALFYSGATKNLHSLVVSTDTCNQLTMTNSTTWKNFNPYFPGTSFSWVSGDTCIAVVVDSGSSRL